MRFGRHRGPRPGDRPVHAANATARGPSIRSANCFHLKSHQDIIFPERSRSTCVSCSGPREAQVRRRHRDSNHMNKIDLDAHYRDTFVMMHWSAPLACARVAKPTSAGTDRLTARSAQQALSETRLARTIWPEPYAQAIWPEPLGPNGMADKAWAGHHLDDRPCLTLPYRTPSDQRPIHCGARFSMNAVRPSR
jgi:hypothetical protein